MGLKDKLLESGSLTDYIVQTSVDNDDIDIIQMIKLTSLEIISNQPFKEYVNTSRYQSLKESVKLNGITNPLIVRLTDDGKYQILSGRHRYLVAKELNLLEVPCIVKKNLSDDDAEIILLDSNLCQREELLPSEKAFSYKQKNDILKRKGVRTDLYNDSNKGIKSVEIIASTMGSSKSEVIRYIRLTNLIPKFLDRLDSKTMPISVGYALSFLSEDSQKIVNDTIENNGIIVSLKMANALKELSNNSIKVSKEDIERVLLNSSPVSTKTSLKKLRTDYLSTYFSDDTSDDEMIETIKKALQLYLNK
jgi:ParB family chromosome partitioning protein